MGDGYPVRKKRWSYTGHLFINALAKMYMLMVQLSLPVPEKYFLYAEDDEDDQELLTDIIERLDPSITVICCKHGLELVQFLEAMPGGQTLPCCIVLDMNMPMWDGLHTLAELRKREGLRQVPIIIFTTSSAIMDAERSRQLGAEAFLTKPTHEEELEKVARQFSIFCERRPLKKQFF